MRLLDGDTSIVGGIVRREFKIPSGTVLVSHVHPYSHLSVLYSGDAILTKNGTDSLLKGPCMVTIEANTEHRVEAVTDCIWDCLHALELAVEAEANGDDIVLREFN